ncbi:MAG: hypothetical protein PHU16_11365, partial [Atribacterota bacterium]|nr:hypothetical protein [Atribacterota bacterium]
CNEQFLHDIASLVVILDCIELSALPRRGHSRVSMFPLQIPLVFQASSYSLRPLSWAYQFVAPPFIALWSLRRDRLVFHAFIYTIR